MDKELAYPANPRTFLQVRIPLDLDRRLREETRRRGESLAHLVETLLRQQLDLPEPSTAKGPQPEPPPVGKQRSTRDEPR